jgi:hypothetical protein
MAAMGAPLEHFRVLTPFPEVKKGARTMLSQFRGKVTVLHMYTG